jgi:Glycosyltransferase family 87
MSEKKYGRVLGAAALLLAAVLASRPGTFWDYATDAGPALAAIAHGSVTGFFSHQPAMGPLSLYVRAPFVVLAAALHDGPVGIYRWGCLPCVLAVAGVALWLAQTARRSGAGRLAMALIVAISLVNPLVSDALYWGHPEELLTASLAIGAILAAGEGRGTLTAVFAGLAIASKQWAVLILVPAVLLLEKDRIRILVLSGAVAVLAWLPMILANLAAFRHALRYVSHPQPVVTLYTWLYPLSRTGTVTVTNIFGDSRTFDAHQLLGVEATLARPLITVLGVAIPLLVWWRAGRRATVEQMLLASALVLVCRCALDPGSMAYYHFPLLLILLAYDAVAGRRVPLAGLAGVAVSFVVLDRSPAYLGMELANCLYIATTVTGCALLGASLRRLPKGNVGILAPAL